MNILYTHAFNEATKTCSRMHPESVEIKKDIYKRVYSEFFEKKSLQIMPDERPSNKKVGRKKY